MDLRADATRSPSSPGRARDWAWRRRGRCVEEGAPRDDLRARRRRAPDAARGPGRASPGAGRGAGRAGRRLDADGAERVVGAHVEIGSAASTSWSTTSARRAAATSSRRPTTSGRARSTRRCFRRSACRAWSCRTCARRAAASILMIASIWGRESGGRMTYNAVKAAEISLAKAMAQQLARDNIRVNSVAPGSIAVRGRIVVEAPAGGPGGHRRLRRARDSVRPLRPAGGSRRGRRVPRLARAPAGSPAPASPVDGGQCRSQHLTSDLLDERESPWLTRRRHPDSPPTGSSCRTSSPCCWAAGVFLTLRLGFVQVRRFGDAFRAMLPPAVGRRRRAR